MTSSRIATPQEIKIVIISSVYLTISKKFMMEGEARTLRITRAQRIEIFGEDYVGCLLPLRICDVHFGFINKNNKSRTQRERDGTKIRL